MILRILKIILVVALVPLAIYLWPTQLGGDTGFLMVQGKSMLPTIEGGSVVITKKMDSYEIGDIVSFTQREENTKIVIVHRIVEETESGFGMKGDNNSFYDPGHYTADEIQGKVIFATPYIGSLLGLAGNPIIMISTFAGTTMLQYVLKKRKEKREKIRRISLGIKSNDFGKKNKPKKPDYTTFFGAIACNVMIYAFSNYAISLGAMPQGDMLTGFFYRLFEKSFASTIIFAIYIMIIFGLYFGSKVYERRMFFKSQRPSKSRSSTIQLVLGKNFNPVLTVAQFLWFLYIIMSVFQMMTLGKDIMDIVTCDPTKALC